jgi:hypothetical protein
MIWPFVEVKISICLKSIVNYRQFETDWSELQHQL